MKDASRVLVVEDEGLVALDLQDRLIKAGYDVPDVATSSEEALRLTESLNPDLVLMDIRLRGPRDGIATAQDIHARATIPIIFVTANADAATLKRARASRPAGFFVKPVPFASLMSSMEMAIYRSRADQYSAFLAARQDDSDKITFITDLDGKVEFVSPAISRWVDSTETDLLGSPLSSLISLASPGQGDWAREVLSRLAGQHTVHISRSLFLALPGGTLKVPVTAEASLHRFSHDSLRVVWELRDLSGSDWNEQQIRSEQKLMARGLIASGISDTTYRLFEIIPGLKEPNAESIAAVEMFCQTGMEISRQLTTGFNGNHYTPELLDVNNWLTTNRALLSKWGGSQISVCFDLSAQPAEVRLPAHSLGQLFMSTFESLRRRLAGPGTIHVRSHIVQGLREAVRLEFRMERSGPAAWTPFVFPFERENSHLEISLASAIVAAAGGRMGYVQSWANAAQLEILLPRPVDPRKQNSPDNGVVLLVGTGTRTTAALEKQFEADGKRVIRSANEVEALIVAELQGGDIAAVVADVDSVSTRGRERVERAFLDRNPATKFIWQTFGCPPFDVSLDLA